MAVLQSKQQRDGTFQAPSQHRNQTHEELKQREDEWRAIQQQMVQESCRAAEGQGKKRNDQLGFSCRLYNANAWPQSNHIAL